MPASPVVTGTPATNQSAGASSSQTLTLTSNLSAGGNGVVVVFVTLVATSAQGQRTVSSINSTNLPSANWALRARKAQQQTNLANQWVDIEEWWIASTANLSAEVITVTFSGSTADVSLLGFGVLGVGSSTSPWDPNAVLGGNPPTASAGDAVLGGSSTTPTMASALNTTNADDLLIGVFGTGGSSGYTMVAGQLAGGTATLQGTPHEGAGTFSSTCAVETRSVTGAVTNGNFTWSGASTIGWVLLVDALTADSSGITATPLVAGAPILGTPVMGVFSTLVLGSSVLDFGLNRLHTNANFLYICSTVPTTYVQATTTYAIGSASVAAGTLFGAMGNGSPSGRIVNSAVINTGAVTGAGTPVCWAVIDSVNSDLLASGPAAGFSAVTSGQTWQLGSFDVHMSNT